MIRTLTVIALILVLLAVSACGGGDDSDTESFATTSTSSMDAFDMDDDRLGESVDGFGTAAARSGRCPRVHGKGHGGRRRSGRVAR